MAGGDDIVQDPKRTSTNTTIVKTRAQLDAQKAADQQEAKKLAAQQTALQQTMHQPTPDPTTISQSAEIKKARATQRGVRCSINKQLVAIKKLLDENARETTTFEQLEDTLIILQTKVENLAKADNQLMSLLQDEDEIEIEVEGIEDFLDEVTTAKTNANRRMKELQGGVSSGNNDGSTGTEIHPPEGNSNASKGANSNSSYNPSDNLRIKLPELTLAKFNGDPTKWTSFWNRFSTLIGSSNMDKVVKFHYLVSYLEGKAAKAVEELYESDDSYDEAVAILKDRFGNVQSIVQSHMNKLLDLQPVISSDDLKALRSLLDIVEISVRSLKLLGVNTSGKGSLLCPTLLRCIPGDMRTLLCQNKDSNDDWDADEIVKFLRRQIESREMSGLLGASKTTEKSKFYNQRASSDRQIQTRTSLRNNPQEQTKFSSSALNTQIEKTADGMFCIFCKSTTHRTSNCRNLNLEKKRDFIRDSNRCFICLKLGHTARRCQSAYRNCRICGRGHNMAVCDKNTANIVQKASGSNQNKDTETLNNSDSAVVTSVQGSDTNLSKRVVLQTAKAIASNPTQVINRIPIRMVLDGGSQGTFVTEEVGRSLNLPVVGEQCLNVGSFMETTPKKAIRKSHLVFP